MGAHGREIKVGDRAKDDISGLKGIVVARTEWLNGCVRLTIRPEQLHEGKPVEQQTFDAEELSLVDSGIMGAGLTKMKSASTGGDRPAAFWRMVKTDAPNIVDAAGKLITLVRAGDAFVKYGYKREPAMDAAIADAAEKLEKAVMEN